MYKATAKKDGKAIILTRLEIGKDGQIGIVWYKDEWNRPQWILVKDLEEFKIEKEEN